MTKQRWLTLVLILLFLISAFILMNESFNRKSLDPEASNSIYQTESGLADSLKESFKEGSLPLLDESDVQELLSPDNRDAARALTDGDAEKEERLLAAAEKIVSAFSECVADGTHCGADSKEWEEYFGTGAPPLHNALLRALGIFEVSGAELDQELLFEMMKAPSFNLSYAAASMALDRAQELDDKAEVLKKSRSLKDKARALFYEKYASQAPAEDLFVEELAWSVNEKSDVYTRSEVLSRIDKFNLDYEAFRFVAFQACRGVTVDDEENRREKVVNLLYRKSQDMGMSISKNQLCSLPDEAAED